VIDHDLMAEKVAHEDTQVARLQEIAERWTEIDERWDSIVAEILDEL
jgi:tetrahydromethanopterin S-methyltransferase subunit G